MIVAGNRGFRREIIWDFFSLIWDFFAIFCQASRYRARFQASSGHSDSTNMNRPGYEAGPTSQLTDFGGLDNRVLNFSKFKKTSLKILGIKL